MGKNVFDWMQEKTKTVWYVDTADINEVEHAIGNHVKGVTTNPLLIARALKSNPSKREALLSTCPANATPDEKAEYIVSKTVGEIASLMYPIYEATKRVHGYVCAQVDPSLANDQQRMVAMAKRFATLAPNILVKLPATSAGIDALEECTAAGINTTGTVSFSFSQMREIAEHYMRGVQRLVDPSTPPKCVVVLMVGRLEDFIVGSLRDRGVMVPPEIGYAIEAIGKRAYSYFLEHDYPVKICYSGLRTVEHCLPFFGWDAILSISPKTTQTLLESNVRWQSNITTPVDEKVVESLRKFAPFVQMYEPLGLSSDEFYTFGETQHTLTQFVESGWNALKEI
jgi:transaldolase